MRFSINIYVIKPGDNINSIAADNNTSVNQIITDNGLENPFSLVPGQTLVITNPIQTHIVKEGDTLTGIVKDYGITLMQLLRNNPFLSDRKNIYPGETLVIRYQTNGKISTNGYTYPYIDNNTLIKTLPFLTYLSVFNYKVSESGDISNFRNDSDVVRIAKLYGVMPLMMISSLYPEGKPDIEAIYNILISETYQEHFFIEIIKLLKSTGYLGINLLLFNINIINETLYINFLSKLSTILKDNGYELFVTIDPNIKKEDNKITFEQINYSNISKLVNGITFMQYTWGTYYGPPTPVTSINLLTDFIEYVVKVAPTDDISIGTPLIGYDWELPYTSNSYAYSLTLNSVITLANDVGATIQFDETSQTPYFKYSRSYSGVPREHIVWFIDARTMNSIDTLIVDYNLKGSGIWNIMIYFQQLWTINNSQYEIIKLLPDNL